VKTTIDHPSRRKPQKMNIITVRQYIQEHDLSPEGYDDINDDQEIESIYRTPAGDEMIVFGLGQGQIVNPRGGGSVAQNGDIADFLSLPNESDWVKQL
jgi:hypothetical protein